MRRLASSNGVASVTVTGLRSHDVPDHSYVKAGGFIGQAAVLYDQLEPMGPFRPTFGLAMAKQIMLGDDSNDASVVVHDRQATDFPLEHQLGSSEHRDAGFHSHHLACHEVCNPHRKIPAKFIIGA